MNDYDTPEIRCSLRNLSRVTEWSSETPPNSAGKPRKIAVAKYMLIISEDFGI